MAEPPSENVPADDPSLPVAVSGAGAEFVQATPDDALNPPPLYPRSARERGWEGAVTVRVMVQADGRVAEAALEQSSGHAPLDRSALRTVRGWKFHPARRGSLPVQSEVLIPVIFRLRDAQ